ncbi:MAG: DUF1513 domain-containing protein [Pseudomonadota bacterium]
MYTRRNFLFSFGLLGASIGLGAAWWSREGRDSLERLYVSAAEQKKRGFGLGWTSETGEEDQHVLSGFRGHAVVQHPVRPENVLMIGRRPAAESIEASLTNGRVVRRFHAGNQRHFYGHACFSRDGKHLYTTENDLRTGDGLVVVRDALDYRVLNEMPSYGIGPHQIESMPDGRTLVVANGGIKTHPSFGRKKLNLDSMQSSLTFIDRLTGELLERQRVEEAKASIRHLSVSDSGRVAVAMQVQRQAMIHGGPVALAATCRQGEALRLLREPAEMTAALKDYLGSVAICEAAGTVAATSPRGNVAIFWRLEDGAFGGYHRLFDVCGVTVTHDQRYFALSNSQGHIHHIDARTFTEDKSQRLHLAGVRWDNHLTIARL